MFAIAKRASADRCCRPGPRNSTARSSATVLRFRVPSTCRMTSLPAWTDGRFDGGRISGGFAQASCRPFGGGGVERSRAARRFTAELRVVLPATARPAAHRRTHHQCRSRACPRTRSAPSRALQWVECVRAVVTRAASVSVARLCNPAQQREGTREWRYAALAGGRSSTRPPLLHCPSVAACGRSGPAPLSSSIHRTAEKATHP